MIIPLGAAAIVTGIGQCIIDELNDTPESGGVPAKMRVCLLVPGNIAWDGCDCGQLAQTIVSDYHSERFPADSSQEQIQSCGEALAVQVLVSILRCVPGMSTGMPPQYPTCAKLLDAALIMQGDAFAVRTGVECCLLDLKATQRIFDFRVGPTTYVGPEGGCAGSELTYWFQLM